MKGFRDQNKSNEKQANLVKQLHHLRNKYIIKQVSLIQKEILLKQ